MAKKSFTDNPAEQFISSIREEKEVPQVEVTYESKMESKKESIEESAPSPANAIAPSKFQVPEGYKLDPRFIEKRTKRVNLLMQPSLYEKIQAKASQEKKSVNDFIHSYMEELLKK